MTLAIDPVFFFFNTPNSFFSLQQSINSRKLDVTKIMKKEVTKASCVSR